METVKLATKIGVFKIEILLNTDFSLLIFGVEIHLLARDCVYLGFITWLF